MDKVTKGFVIAACSVVIATPIGWFAGQYLEAQQQEAEFREEAQRQQADRAEKNRKISRISGCSERERQLFGDVLDQTTEETRASSAYLDRCLESTLPIAEVK